MADNIIRIMCPNLRCRAILAVPSEARGRLVRCKACASNIRIPQKVEKVSTPDPADAAKQDAGTDSKKASEAA